MNDRLFAYRARLQVMSGLLLAAELGLVAVLTWLAWGIAGIVVMGILVVVLVLLNSSPVGPRVGSLQELDSYQAPQLFVIINTLAQRAGLSYMPRVFLSNSPQVNAAAFLHGSDANTHALILTRGLLDQLPHQEIRAVLAHEVSHMRSGDVQTFRLLGALQTLSISMAISMVLFLPFSPLITLLALSAPWLGSVLTAAYSRTREFAADLGAAILTHDALALARALYRIENRPRTWMEAVFGIRLPRPETADGLQNVYRSHPPGQERIRRLTSIAALMEDTRLRPLPRAGVWG